MYSTIYPLNFPSARINDLIRPLKVKDKYGWEYPKVCVNLQTDVR